MYLYILIYIIYIYVHIYVICTFCNTNIEGIKQLFWERPYSQDLWVKFGTLQRDNLSL